jgi:hypothetical protein
MENIHAKNSLIPTRRYDVFKKNDHIYIYMEMTFPSNEQYQILFGTMLKQGHKI